VSDQDQAALRIEVVRDAATRAAWLEVPYRVFKDDPAWIAPLRIIEAQRFEPKHPFFSFGEACFFVAFRGREPIGRISAQINRRHLELYKDETGHFGFFDCFDDQAAAQALVDAAAAWLGERGMKRMVGPLNFSTNEESGLLVEGFDTPPAILMTHARRWFGPLLERAGLCKVMDLYAYRMKPDAPSDRMKRLAAKARDNPRIQVRQVDTRRLQQEIELLVEIFNDAWSQNWGFVPFAPQEIDAMVKEIRPFFRSNFGRFVLIDGRPAAVMLALPDINGVAADFNGRLLPFNWVKLVASLGAENFRSARIPLLGIRQEHQRTRLASSVLALLVHEFLEEGKGWKLDWYEFSWVLENNRAMNALGHLTAGPPVKTYRVYEKALADAS
jgi:hypothetical protein